MVFCRFRPIRVFCLHQISDFFDPVKCYEGDWVSTVVFKQTIESLKHSYRFISLTEAQHKLKTNVIRLKRYAVLTFDDGYASIVPSLQWLEHQGIPYALFVNAKYFDGVSFSPHILKNAKLHSNSIENQQLVKGLYLSINDIKERSYQYCQIGSHGFEHVDATLLPASGFIKQVEDNQSILLGFNGYIPFYAYTWGNHSFETDRILKEMDIVPVLMDGQMNYDNPSIIHRELFPSSVTD